MSIEQSVTIEVPPTLPIHHRAALGAARPLLSWAVALRTYRRLYRHARRAPGTTFCARALDALNIAVETSPGDLLQIPEAGPLVIVANHPHGMLDGLALAHLVQRRRSDVRILTNHLISCLPELSDLCLFVDPSEQRAVSPRSTAGLRSATRWVAAGHALIVFPSGVVAHAFTGDAATPADAPWRDTAARLASRTGATVLPAFIEGRNSRWFYRAGRVHPVLRTLMLPRELLRKRGTRVTIRIGSPLASCQDRLARGAGRPDIATLRASVEQLAGRVGRLSAEIAALDDGSRLLSSGVFEVFCARASQIPTVLQEIGRLREVTFRAVGEGTGRPVDLDEFDQHYLHLFVWNGEAREVIGAYRLGLTDEIVGRHGVAGLYTATLFRYDARLVARLAPAIELGRSFVREEYQRSSNALLLLWKGIAAFVARSRKYRVLFGPVSISARYGDTSQQLLKAFLAQNFYRRELGELVQAHTPPVERPLPQGIDPTTIADIRNLDALIARMENDGKGVPVLLRQYLRLNAKLLGFNVDPAFGNALDALMMVDLADVSPSILARYFGKDTAAELLSRLLAPDRAAA